jgi:cytoskeletal protein CcmA (bactofilin family)
MVFDAVFMLRDRWPELFEAAASVGAMAAFSALGCAALHALSRRLTGSSSLPLVLLLLLTAPDIASALDIRRDQDTHIAAGETVSETIACTGDVVTIDGTIDGDLIVGAERFTMRGTVTGNLYFFASEVDIDGVVEGSMLGIADRVAFEGRVDGAVVLGGDRLNLMDEARLGRDVALFGEGVRIAGSAARDVTFAGDWIEVRAEIGRDLHVLGADRIALLDSARVGRDVRGNLWGHQAEIEQAPGAVVSGEVSVSKESIVREHYLAHYTHPSFYLFVLVSAAAAFVFGLLIYLFDPRLFEADPPDVRAFARSAGIGFIVLLAGPVALMLVGLTVIGIPVAVLGLFVLISAVYASYVLVAGLVGQAVLTPSGPGLGAFAPALLIGVLILSAVAALPFVGPAVRILAVLFGLGCLAERVRGLRALNLRSL